MTGGPDPEMSPGVRWRLGPDPDSLMTPVQVGIHLGTDREGRSVALPGPGPDGTRIGVLGEPLFGRLFALRALAAGSRVTALTRRPGEWTGVWRAAGGRLEVTGTPRTWPTDPPPAPVSVDEGPQTLVSDLRGPPAQAAAAGPWRTVLHVSLRPPRRSAFWSRAGTVLVLGAEFAETAGQVLGQPAAELVAATHTGEVAVFRADGAVSVVRPDVSADERLLLTPYLF